MDKRIHLISENSRKVAEYQRVFSRYGYTVDQTPVVGVTYKAILKDESNLYSPTGEVIGPLVSEGVATNRCTVTAIVEGQEYTFIGVVEGRMVPPRTAEGDNVFDWDNRYVPSNLQGTYHEMHSLGLKCSARDIALSQVMSLLDYKKDYNLRFQPVTMQGIVDFSQEASVEAFVENNAFIKGLPSDSLPAQLIRRAGAGGIFFRLKTNSRNGNYWNPGFAGIPFTPKKDPVHEVTYLVHDLMHHLQLDFPYDGSTSLAARNTYLVSRMMSEAWSLVLADMLFVNELRNTGMEYPWEKRCILPLYDDLTQRGYTLRDLLWAVTRFVITGSYEHIPASVARDRFVEKYSPFFSADWKWTRANWEALLSRQEAAKLWVSMVGVSSFTNLGLVPLGMAVNRMGVQDSDTLEQVMQQAFDYHYLNLISAPPSGGEGTSTGNAIRRWALGQTAAYARYYPLAKTTAGLQTLLRIIQDPDTTEFDGGIARATFETFLEVLRDFGAISPDDFRLFREIFPHYDPFFVSYKEESLSVAEAVQQAWSLS